MFRRKPRLNREEITVLIIIASQEIRTVQEELIVGDSETEQLTRGYIADVESVITKLKEMY